MMETVVITGASRGLGLASAEHLYKTGWRVIAAMRSVAAGMERLRAATGASADDPRLRAVQLDLEDNASIANAARAIIDICGAPDVLVHNAGIAAAGTFEDTPDAEWTKIFATNVFGPMALTKALLPSMRAARHGRIVIISSMGAVRGMPAISAYSASKGALERWGESLAGEIAGFGLGVSVVVTGTYKTDILVQTADYRNYDGAYGSHYIGVNKIGDLVIKVAGAPAQFARILEKAMTVSAPYARYTAGIDAFLLLLFHRLLPGRLLHGVICMAMGLPRPGRLRALPKVTEQSVERS